MANKKPIKKKKFSGLAKKTKFNPKHSKKVIKKKYINNGVFDDEGHIKAQMKFGEIVLEKINEKISTFKK